MIDRLDCEAARTPRPDRSVNDARPFRKGDIVRTSEGWCGIVTQFYHTGRGIPCCKVLDRSKLEHHFSVNLLEMVEPYRVGQ